jgi:acetyl esterase/lipase
MRLLLPLLLAGVPARGADPKSAEESTGGAPEPLAYKTVGETVLHLACYRPEGWKREDRRPAIVFFFGGGWKSGSPRQFQEHCRRLAARGMVAFAAEYRIKNLHGSTPIESTLDAKSAVRWIRAHAGELGVDPARVAAGGGSAGGHLAAATATVEDAVNDPGDDLAVSAVPDALVLFNPAVDLSAAKPHVRETWGEEVSERALEISPLHRMKRLPPTILFHGTADTAVPIGTVEAFARRAEELGTGPVRLERYEGRPHGFFNVGRGDGNDAEDTMAKMEAFLAGLGWIRA